MKIKFNEEFLVSFCSAVMLIFVGGCGGRSFEGQRAAVGKTAVLGSNSKFIPPTGQSMGDAHSKEYKDTVLKGTACQRGSTLGSKNPNKTCLGLKYVVYEDPKSTPVVSVNEAIENINQINQVWSQCQISFQIDEYLSTNPKDAGLRYQPRNDSELDDIRKSFTSDTSILVVTTGRWDRSGSLGNTGANAWTAMPGETLYGTVLESPVGTFSNIIAHELGHYLNLMHVSDSSDLMNPIIYDSSNELSLSQCQAAQDAIQKYWGTTIR